MSMLRSEELARQIEDAVLRCFGTREREGQEGICKEFHMQDIPPPPILPFSLGSHAICTNLYHPCPKRHLRVYMYVSDGVVWKMAAKFRVAAAGRGGV